MYGIIFLKRMMLQSFYKNITKCYELRLFEKNICKSIVTLFYLNEHQLFNAQKLFGCVPHRPIFIWFINQVLQSLDQTNGFFKLKSTN